jgi:CheY-like chemotaxis protein
VNKKYILYADDDSDDINWVSEACKDLDLNWKIEFVANGREVMEHLFREPALKPSLVVLDLNMPEMDGRQTLQQLKASDSYKNIPVAIVTTSANKMDKEVCRRLGASLYLTKPDSHVEWQDIVRQLKPFVEEVA